MAPCVSRSGSIPGGGKALFFQKKCIFSPFHTQLLSSQTILYHSRKLSEQPEVRARRQSERFRPGNHLKNLKNPPKFKNLVIAEEPESDESKEKREYSDLDGLDGLFSGEIFLRTSFTQCNNGKTTRRPETLQVKFYHNNDSAQSKHLFVGWHDLISSDSQALNHKIPPAVLNMIYASVSGHLIPAGSVERYRMGYDDAARGVVGLDSFTCPGITGCAIMRDGLRLHLRVGAAYEFEAASGCPAFIGEIIAIHFLDANRVILDVKKYLTRDGMNSLPQFRKLKRDFWILEDYMVWKVLNRPFNLAAL